MISKGKYKALVMDVDFGPAKSGTPQVAVSLKIIDDEAYEGDYITYFGSFHENAQQYTFQALEAAGWQGVDLESAPDDCIGSEVQIVTDVKTWDGKDRAEVKFINRPGGGGLKERFEGSSRKDFFASMNRKYKALTKGQKKEEEEETPFEKKKKG